MKRKFKWLLIANEKKFSLPSGDENNYSNNEILFPSFRLKIKRVITLYMGFPDGSVVKNLPTKQETDTGSILGSGRSSGGGNGNPLQYSCLENPIDRVW